ncbi:hypothetical protein [Tissierella praeacuta]|uniref:hypothetical protein n=1 Tax=Tissierella praeacuta TaxID=43131 RepID=UPI00334110FE
MNFIDCIKFFIPINFLTIYFLMNIRNIYFSLLIIIIFCIRIFNLTTKAYHNIPENYKRYVEKYIPKNLNISFEENFVIHYIESTRRRAVFMKEYGIKIVFISTIFMIIINKIYSGRIFDYIVDVVIYIFTIFIILWMFIILYYDIKSYNGYKSIYNKVEKEIDKFLIWKSILVLLTQLIAVIFMRTKVNI